MVTNCLERGEPRRERPTGKNVQKETSRKVKFSIEDWKTNQAVKNVTWS